MSDSDFAAMLEESFAKTKDNWQSGERVVGKIIQIANDSIFVDISGKSEGVVSKSEFIDKDEKLTIKKGDELNFYVVEQKAGEVILTSSLGRGILNYSLLQMSYKSQLPLVGKVIGENKGGYEISLGEFKGFCPFSQIDMYPNKDHNVYLFQEYEFIITTLANNGRKIVLSRRVLLEEKDKELKNNLKKQLQVGDTVEGQVTGCQSFGLFVEVAGLKFLVPASELSYSRLVKVENFSAGQKIKGKIINLDWKNEKFSLSLKQLTLDPWNNVNCYLEGKEYEGKISNIINKGAFVELAPGIEAYLPVSRMSYVKRINSPSEVVEKGQTVRVKLLSLDKEERKMLVELVSGEGDPWLNIKDDFVEQEHKCYVEAVVNAGVRVRLASGLEGFVPNRELVKQKGDVQKNYETGSSLTVSVKEVKPQEHRLVLSEVLATSKKEMNEYKDYMSQTEEENSNGLSLGAMFKDSFADLQNKINK